MSCGIVCRCCSDPELLWRKLAALALIPPLAWELPYAAVAALKRKKKKKKQKAGSVMETGLLGQKNNVCKGSSEEKEWHFWSRSKALTFSL